MLALALAVTVLWPLPALLTRHPSQGLSPAERLKATNDVRGTLVQALAGLALLGGLLFTARTFRLGVKNSDLALQEQLTDRYTKAVEQLGSEKLDVRLGGIYALERLMVDSGRDHPTIVEVLAAFLREHAVVPTSASTRAWPLPVGAAEKAEKATLAPMPADIAAAARVIARRPSGRKERGPLGTDAFSLRYLGTSASSCECRGQSTFTLCPYPVPRILFGTLLFSLFGVPGHEDQG